MKTFLLLLLVSLPSWAGFVAGSKANLCSRTDYSSPATCQDLEGEPCYKVPEDSGECGIFKLKDLYGTVKHDEETCDGQASCQELLAGKVCGIGRVPFIDENYTEVYCVEVVGKELVFDQALKAQKEAQKVVQAQIQQTIEEGRKAREACLRVLDLIGGFNLGRSGEQTDQMVATFALAKQHLQNGLPGKAKYAIQQIPVDGVLVTQTMKDLALAQLADYEARP